MRQIAQRRGRLDPTTRRLIRSYGLLVLIALAFLLMALMIREKEQTVPAESMPFGPSVAAELT